MQVAIDRQASGLKPHLSLVSLFEALLDPIAFSGSLLAVAGVHGVAGDPAYVVLAVTVFLLAQPLLPGAAQHQGRAVEGDGGYQLHAHRLNLSPPDGSRFSLEAPLPPLHGPPLPSPGPP